MLDAVTQAYQRSERVDTILQKLEEEGKLCLKGLSGSLPSMYALAVFSKTEKTVVVVVDDKEEAAYTINDLENFIDKEQLVYFPNTGRRPYDIEEVDNANVLLRTDAIKKLGDQKPRIIVCYPSSLSEQVVSTQTLVSKSVNIRKGDQLDLDFINESLYELGFERVDFVTGPGQFAIRGGIIDVFSFGSEDPIRIDLFGDEVEGIKIFDAGSQLSKKILEEVVIVPNLSQDFSIQDRTSLMNFLGDDIICMFRNVKLSLDVLKNLYEKAEEAKVSKPDEIRFSDPEKLFVSDVRHQLDLERKKVIEYGPENFFDAREIELRSTPQPSFNKNFELLNNNLAQLHTKGIRTWLCSDNEKQLDRLSTILEDIGNHTPFNTAQINIHDGFIDHDHGIAILTDHQIFNRYHRFKLRDSVKKAHQAMTLKELNKLQKGDFVVHIDHGVGEFSGLQKLDVQGKQQEAIRLTYKNGDILYVSIYSLHKISRYTGKEGTAPKLDKLGGKAWQKAKQKTKSSVKKIAFDLIKLYAERKAKKGFAFSPDNYLQHELEASFLYEDTPDQYKATVAVKRDMEAEAPMDRLICGDVGFGKTEIAIRAAFKAVCDSKQVVILAPTTILTLQHYHTFKKRMEGMPCTVDYINRFKTRKEQTETLKKLAAGEVDIIIGTHRLVGKDIKFKDLGLLIIDEEQKFGVSVKDKLKTLKVNMDTLTLTATPIPRTLQFSMMGARDLSVINTPPPNRQPVETELKTFHEVTIRDAIMYEVERGGQVFFVHNRVQNIEEVAGMVQRLCPDVRVLIAHGQMKGEDLEARMIDFIEGRYDVLVATTIIESGLDIPNANTIIINQAHMFGLSDLHQMRGRVGRSNKKAFCYLLAPPMSTLTPEARKRLNAIEQFSDLGSGFQIAMRDLDIRGAGNLLGGEQSGFISEIGFDTYQKILNEAIQELKENEFKDLYAEEMAATDVYVNETAIETDLEVMIPDSYMSNIAERLGFYKDLDAAESEEELERLEYTMVDRFGPVPHATQELFNLIRLRWMAKDMNFEKVMLKNKKLFCYFISKPNSPYYQTAQFTTVLSYIQSNPNQVRMREKNDKLSLAFENIRSIEQAVAVLQPIFNVLRDVDVPEPGVN